MNRIYKTNLRHYGVKGMEWGKTKKEDLVGINKSSPLTKDVSLPFTLSKDLPKVQPRAYQQSKSSERIKQEVEDDVKNRITNFDKVPRFNPKNESINTALRKVNEGYAYSSLIDGQMARDYDLYDDDGTVKHFSNNCPSATFAYELRRRGIDVEAGLTGGATTTEIADAFNIDNEEWKKALKETSIPPKTIEELEAAMKAMGPGARGFCVMAWNNGGGHINAFEINAKGEIVYIDAQTGISSEDLIPIGKDNPANYHKDARHYIVLRVDNKKMNQELVKDWVRVDDRIEPGAVDRVKKVDDMNTKRKTTEQAKINREVPKKEFLTDANIKKKNTALKEIKKDSSFLSVSAKNLKKITTLISDNSKKLFTDLTPDLISSGKKLVNKLLRRN